MDFPFPLHVRSSLVRVEILQVQHTGGTDMKIQTSLLAGLTAAYLWSVAHAVESPKLAQIKAVISEYRQKSFGPLAGFAGVYDISKTCQPFVRKSAPLDKSNDAGFGTIWLLDKSVIWFEGNDILIVLFVSPTKVDRGTWKFKQDYSMSRDLTVKLYDVKWDAGDTDIMAFLPDRDLFSGKFTGRTYTSDYALRCSNEDQIIGSTEEILRLMGL
jgi:hypothetical protein